MKRSIAFIIMLAVAGIAWAQSAPVSGNPRHIEVVPNGGIAMRQPGATVAGVEYRGFTGAGQDGRCVMVFAPKATFFDDVFTPGNDDALGFVGDTRGSLVANCTFPVAYVGVNGRSKALIAYTNAAASNLPGPTYGAADGYAATFYRCDFQGGSVRLSGGVRQYIGCRFAIGALGAIDTIDAKLNLIDCDFYTIPKPTNFGYWYQNGDPCGIRVSALVNGKPAASPIASRFYIANCRLDGKPASGPELCRRWPTAADVQAGRTAYGLAGSVPASCFVKTPN